MYRRQNLSCHVERDLSPKIRNELNSKSRSDIYWVWTSMFPSIIMIGFISMLVISRYFPPKEGVNYCSHIFFVFGKLTDAETSAYSCKHYGLYSLKYVILTCDTSMPSEKAVSLD